MSETTREQIIGPDSGPEPPFPYKMEGKVISGFGRGSKELGIPTANLPVDETLTPWISTAPSGVYFGWASLQLPSDHGDHNPPPPPTSSTTTSSASSTTSTSPVPKSTSSSSSFTLFPMVMSIGYNPFYKNTIRSAEVHILHKFSSDFYGSHMRLLILGFIREEKDYKSLEALVQDINVDCEVARRSVARVGWRPRGLGEGSGMLKEEEDAGWLVGEYVP